jgi:hypothetical protein
MKHRTRYRNYHDGPLAVATLALSDAVHALCGPQTAQTPGGHTGRLDSRLQRLYDALNDTSVSGHRRASPAAMIPAWIDALKLKMAINTRVAEITAQHTHRLAPTTTGQLDQLRRKNYRPQDTATLRTIARELQSFVIAIDDLFAAKPVILFDPRNPTEWAPCPQCGHHHAYRHTDDGQTIRTPALLLTVERGSWCTHCHATWPPDRLGILAAMLGHPTPTGVLT